MTRELEGTDANLISYWQVLRRRRWWVIGLVLLSVVGGLGYALTATKEYSANAQVLVQQSTASPSLNGTQNSISPTDVLTALQLVTSAPVKAQVAKALGSTPDATASQVGQTNVIEVTATSTNPGEAARVANTYANAFVNYQRTTTINSVSAAESQLQSQINSLNDQVTSLQNGRDSSSSAVQSQITALLNQQSVLKQQLSQLEVNGAVATSGPQIVTPASVPTSPSSPKKTEDVLIGLVIGIVLGLGVAFLVDRFDDTVYSTDELERTSPDIPVLGIVPAVSSWRNTKNPFVVTVADPTSPAAESYRSLRTSLQFAGHEHPFRVILVTSPSAAEGKTSTVSNLAVVLANAGKSVVVVSADLRKPRIGQFFGKDEGAGLTSVIIGESSVSGALQRVKGVDRLSLLGTGPLPHNPAELLQSSKTDYVLGELKQYFDIVLIDSPPVLPVTDAVVLSGKADATLVVVASGRTKGRHLAHAVDTLAQVKTSHLSLVLNAVSREARYGYAYGYGYGYGQRYAGASTYSAHAAAGNGAGGNGNGSAVPAIDGHEPQHARRGNL